MKRRLLSAVMVLAGLGWLGAAAAPAQAAAGCWHSGVHWWCKNVYAAPVYALNWDGNYWEVGKMFTTTSWFDCRDDTGPYVGGPHPYRWEFTRADNGQWGWMKDIDISSETNPLPVCNPT